MENQNIVKDQDEISGYIHQAVMMGWTRTTVDAWAGKQVPPLDAPTVDRAYAQCVDRWIAAANTADAQLYALHVARREALYQRAMTAGDLALAHKILVDQAKLQQQYRTLQRQSAADDKAAAIAERIKARGKPRLAAV